MFAYNDEYAMLLMRALQYEGLRIPEDLSVVGFDDSPIAAFTVPALTSVAIPMHEIGRRAMELLLRLVAGEPGTSVVLATELRVRESTAPPRARA